MTNEFQQKDYKQKTKSIKNSYKKRGEKLKTSCGSQNRKTTKSYTGNQRTCKKTCQRTIMVLTENQKSRKRRKRKLSKPFLKNDNNFHKEQCSNVEQENKIILKKIECLRRKETI